MGCLWFLLLWCLPWFGLCVTSQPNHITVESNKHPGYRLRKDCDSTRNNHTDADILDCGAGHYRERQRPYRGQCVPCNCNGLSHECDPNTGKCLNCQLNTTGDHCERCAVGYYGSAALRTCRICPCPLSQPSHNFALGCLHVRDEYECLCKLGYSGSRCERCAVGYYGDPLTDKGSCQLCDCDHGYLCDSLTGACKHPDEPINNGDCQECENCIQALINDLEAMDSELSRLKSQLQSFGHVSVTLTALRKLELGNNATRVAEMMGRGMYIDMISFFQALVNDYRVFLIALKPKVKELKTDVDGVGHDTRTLEDKADATSSASKELLKNVDGTHQRGQNLLTDTDYLLERIAVLLENLKISNGSNSLMSDNKLTRILEEAGQMVSKMQNSMLQKWLVENEFWETEKVLNYITNNLTNPLNSTQVTANRIDQELISSITDFKDLEATLKQAKEAFNKTNLVNIKNEANLSDFLERFRMFDEVQNRSVADLATIQETLGESADFQTMMEDLQNVYAEMAAELYGAKSSLNHRLHELSKTAIMDDLVTRAEEHAQDLLNRPMLFQMSLLNFTNTSAIYKSIDIINTFNEVIGIINQAEAAAKEAHEAADKSIVDVMAQAITEEAQELKNSANILDDKAKTAEKDPKEAAQKYNITKERLDKVKSRANHVKQKVQALESNVIRDDVGALLNQGKDAAESANKTVHRDEARLQSIREGLHKVRIPSSDSNVEDILNKVNKTLNELHKFVPSLTDNLAKVKNQSGRFSRRTNMSDSIMRIKDMIEKSRQMANMVRGPVLFSGESHIEMRPPKHLADLRAFTALNLMLVLPKDDLNHKACIRCEGKQEKDNLFVLYLGNKNAQKDFVGMVVRDGVLYVLYKLGGIVHEIQTVEITRSIVNSAFMDKVDFHRVYQDAEVIYTRQYSSVRAKELPPITSQPNTTVTLLDLNPDDVVLYVGGYPDDFAPPLELQYPKYRGCIEFNTLNEHILSLYNFQRAVNIKNTDQCLRIETPEVVNYFDGSGYGRIDAISGRAIKFFVLSRQENALLFYMGNEDSHFTVTVEGGFVVLRVTQGNQTLIHQSEGKIFPLEYFRNIKIIQSLNKPEMSVHYPVNILINYRIYTQAFIGGIPAEIATRHNISNPPLRGCLKGLGVDISVKFSEAFGVQPGCSVPFPDCSEPASLIQAYHLSAGSQLQYLIAAEDLNFRPHFSLDLRTRSADGLLLHIADNQGITQVILFMSKGRVKLNVGEGAQVYHRKKINNGDWHNIRFSVEQHSTHLLVDGFRVTDGQLKKDEGISMKLKPPVYVGAGKIQPITKIQGKRVPQKSVIGCIRDFRFYDVLVGEPAVNRGGAPCFDAAVEGGMYFAGGGSYIALEKSFLLGAEFELTFEARPRNVTGILFHCRGHQDYSLSVYLKKGTMVVQMNDGAGDYSTSVTPPLLSCDDSFKQVKVNKKGKIIKLSLGKDSSSAVGPHVLSYSQTRHTLYVGGVPEEKHKQLSVWSSYMGCLKNMKINQAALSFKNVTTVFGSVNVNGCPA